MNSPRVLLLHGVEHRRPRDHWLWWLAEELRRRGVPVQYPQLPSPDAPSVTEWSDLARAELEMLGDGERVVIAHSLGCLLWHRLAPSLPAALRPTRVLLVAPPTNDILWEAIADFATQGPGPAGTAPTLVVGRQTDDYRPVPVTDLAAEWEAEHAVIPGHGHLTPADGFGPWRGVLDWVLDPEADVTAR